MPLFTYKCSDCSLRFEKLVSVQERDSVVCKCGADAVRDGVQPVNVKSSISPSEKVVRSKKEIDLVVGADSEKRWKAHEERFDKRTEGMVEIDPGIKAGENFNPERIVGDKESRELAGEYEEAVKNGDPALKDNWIDKLDPRKEGMKEIK
jgi:putative FmdB family regulatory protein